LSPPDVGSQCGYGLDGAPYDQAFLNTPVTGTAVHNVRAEGYTNLVITGLHILLDQAGRALGDDAIYNPSSSIRANVSGSGSISGLAISHDGAYGVSGVANYTYYQDVRYSNTHVLNSEHSISVMFFGNEESTSSSLTRPLTFNEWDCGMVLSNPFLGGQFP
jgi:hypothetical protein